MEQKCQAHNLKVVGSNPTLLQPTYSIKSMTYTHLKDFGFWGFLFKHDISKD